MWRTLKSLFYELGTQVLKQFGVGRRVAGADIIERLNDSDSEEVTPEPIDVAAGEIRVVTRGQPGGQLNASGGTHGRLLVRAIKRQLGRRDLLCAIVDDFARARVGDHLVERLGRLDLGAADHPSATSRVRLQADLREEGRSLVVLVLSPTLERMIVALVAVEPHGQEELGRVLHHGRRLAEHS